MIRSRSLPGRRHFDQVRLPFETRGWKEAIADFDAEKPTGQQHRQLALSVAASCSLTRTHEGNDHVISPSNDVEIPPAPDPGPVAHEPIVAGRAGTLRIDLERLATAIFFRNRQRIVSEPRIIHTCTHREHCPFKVASSHRRIHGRALGTSAGGAARSFSRAPARSWQLGMKADMQDYRRCSSLTP